MLGHWGEEAVGFRWTEQDSVDNRFQAMDTGLFFSGSIVTPPGPSQPLDQTVKGLCIRIGERQEAAVCYDTELLRVSAAWTGPFLNIDPARYGLIVPPRVAGEVAFTTQAMPGWARHGRFDDTRENAPLGPLPREHAHYDGLFLHDRRTVLAATVAGTRIWESPWFERMDEIPLFSRTWEIAPGDEPLSVVVCGPNGVAAIVGWRDGENPSVLRPDDDLSDAAAPPALQSGDYTTLTIPPRSVTRSLKVIIASRDQAGPARLATLARRVAPPEPLSPLTQPGAPRWGHSLVTRGRVSRETGPFALDTITLPFDNPYRALFFVSGHDFFPNGDAAVCTVHGDVWRVSGIDDRLERIEWKRFATGLFQPLGLKIVGGQVHVVGRDQITRLHDRNGDGEADYFENFNNDGQVTLNGHEYVTCLETDSRGNFYYLKGDSGGRTQHDGSLLKVSADGRQLHVFATGLRNANGMAIGPRDEITVAPQEGEWTPASGVFPVREGGFLGAVHVSHRTPPPTDYDRPICWLPRRVDNSSGGQVWVPANHWGPLRDQLIHFSYGQCTMMFVLREEVGGQWQGAAVPLPLQFLSGAMRGRFRPQDGHLYVSGLHGWVSNSVHDGCFQRVRFQGGTLALPVAIRTYANGLSITFSEPLPRDLAEDPDNYQLEQWNYAWTAQYGSPELKPSQPQVEGRDAVYVESASLLDDDRTVFLEITDLRPTSQLAITCRVPSGEGKLVTRQIYWTLHRIPDEARHLEGLSRRRSSGHLTPAQRQSLVPGLIGRFSQQVGAGEFRDTARRRMAVIQVPTGDAATPLLTPGAFRAVLEGYLRPGEPGEYRLRAVGNGSARVFLNDQLVDGYGRSDLKESSPAAGRSTRELRGYMRLRVEYEYPASADPASFRLLWQPTRGLEESVPATALWSSGEDGDLAAAEQNRRAHEMLAQHRCIRCHVASPPAAEVFKVATHAGPSLASAGRRLNSSWVAMWLLAPDKMRNGTHMPRLLGDPASAEARQRAAHLTALLATLRAPVPAAPDDSRSGAAGQVSDAPGDASASAQSGERLWEELGCIGCHRFTPPAETDEFQRISLHFAAAKYSKPSLQEFLQQPHQSYAASRMPDFALNSDEARVLAAWLISKTEEHSPQTAAISAGDAAIGRQLAVELRCVNCHDFGGELDQAPRGMARFRLGIDLPHETGCLAAAPSAEFATPHFAFPPAARGDLQSALGKPLSLVRSPCAAEEAQQLMDRLRCRVCHGRDGQSSWLPTIVAEEGQTGRPAESLPSLTWTGERLKRSWMEPFLARRTRAPLRPDLKARMPAFPEFARILAAGITAQHGRPLPNSDAPTAANAAATIDAAARRIIGYRLTLKDGGLDCRQCHGVGRQLPVGDDRTRIALGINFINIPERLEKDFYQRFVLDPARYEPSTRMPRLSPDGRTTAIVQLLDGDAAQQFDAIWQYLQTLRGDEP